MKGKVLLIALICFVTGFAHAQSPSKKQIKQHQKNVKASKKDGSMLMSFDTVLYKGEPMMVMLFDNASFSPDLYTVKNLKGETQVVVRKGKKGMMEYCFSKWPERTAYVKEDSKFGNVGKTIIDNRLIAANHLNEKEAETFLTMFPQPASQRGVIGRTVDNVLAPAAYKGNQMVDRGREAPITANAGEIYQGGKLIGKYAETDDLYEKKPVRIYNVRYMSGEQCARIVFFKEAPGEAAVITHKDGKTTYVPYTVEPEVWKWLAEKYYL